MASRFRTPPRTRLAASGHLRAAHRRAGNYGRSDCRFASPEYRRCAHPQGSRKRLGLLAGDAAGFPNGRRVSDDVTDIAARAVAGILAGPQYNYPIGDGVNTNDVPYQETFPYVAWAQSGRQRRHIDPGEAGCTMGAGAACPTN